MVVRKKYFRHARAKGVQFLRNPLLARRLPHGRSQVVFALLAFAFLSILVRAAWLQGVTHEFLQKQGDMRYARTLTIPATRGAISDRNGKVLAASVPVMAIWAVPKELKHLPLDRMQRLASLLDMEVAEIYKKITSEQSFMYLKRQVEVEIADSVQKEKFPGIGIHNEFKRYYPQGEVFSQVVGVTNKDDKGQEGIELSYQDQLQGSSGYRQIIKDRLGNIIDDNGTAQDPIDGRNLTLLIDGEIQYTAYTQLQAAVKSFHAKSSGALVIDAHNGEILAMANFPSFDPNDRKGWRPDLLRNRVITDTYEPGSVLKPFTVALAIDSERATSNTRIDTGNGRLVINGAPITDTSSHGTISVAEIIQHSSNIGTAKIALGIPSREMWEFLHAAGFGRRPWIGVPGAASGRLRPFQTWKPIEQATMSYGNGISASLLQVASAYTMFANDGEIVALTLEKTQGTPLRKRVIKAETSRAMRNMLELAASPKGTAPQARIEGFRVGGKTGTAYKAINGRYTVPRRYTATFVGVVPITAPRFIIAVMIDEPTGKYHYAGQVAAPAFAAIAARTLNVFNISPDSGTVERPFLAQEY